MNNENKNSDDRYMFPIDHNEEYTIDDFKQAVFNYTYKYGSKAAGEIIGAFFKHITEIGIYKMNEFFDNLKKK